MKFKVNREKLQKALSRVGSIIGSRSMLPLIGNVRMEAVGGMLHLATTDLELRISTSIEADIIEEGVSTAPARKLMSLVSSFSASDVDFDIDGQDHINITCGSGRFKLLGLAAADFPEGTDFDSENVIQIKGGDLKRMIGSISYAVGADDSRKALTGILFSIKDGTLTLVATDSKRMAVQGGMPVSITGEDNNAIVPLKAMTEIRRLLDNEESITVNIGRKMCRFESKDFVLDTKLVDGNYPDYRLVIPKEFRQMVELPVEVFKSKIETVALMLSENSSFVVLKFEEDQLSIAASSAEIGEGCDKMQIDYKGEPFEVSFNPVFLADPLRNIDADMVSFKINDPLNPVAMEAGNGFLYVIMPIRKK